MPKSEISDSESEENVVSEEESEPEKGKNVDKIIPEYEKQRLKRIGENKKRMEALGLSKMATSLMGSVEKVQKMKNEKKNGKKKMVDEDDEYNPVEDDDEEMRSSSQEDESDGDYSMPTKKMVKKNTPTPKKRGPARRLMVDSDFVDDDDALMEAIALSLQDSAGFLDVKSSSTAQGSAPHHSNNASNKTSTDMSIDSRKESSHIQDDSGKKKRKKLVSRIPVVYKCLKMK